MCYKNALSEQGFGTWVDFLISLSLWELQVVRDCFCVRDIAASFCNLINNAWKRYSYRDLIRTLSKIYDGFFLWKQLKASSS